MNSGAGVGVIKEVLSVKQVVARTQIEAREIVKRLASMLFLA